MGVRRVVVFLGLSMLLIGWCKLYILGSTGIFLLNVLVFKFA